MHSTLLITDVVLTRTGAADRAEGLLGYVACTVDFQLRLDGLTLRRKAQGGHSISFPERRDSNGDRRPYMRPIDPWARRDIERQILGALRARGEIP